MATLFFLSAIVALATAQVITNDQDPSNDSRFKMSVQPQQIYPSTTQTLTINCEYNMPTVPDRDEDISSFISISIEAAKPEQPEIFETLVSLNPLGDSPTPELSRQMIERNAKAAGELGTIDPSDKLRKNKLSLEINDPKTSDAQMYRCTVYGLNGRGVPVPRRQEREVTIGRSNIDDLDARIKALDKVTDALKKESNTYLSALAQELRRLADIILVEVWGLKGSVEKLTNKAHDALNQNQNINQFIKLQDSEFHVSSPKNGSRYLVSKQEKIFSLEEGNQACKSLGGYLVEIENQAELNYVTRFIEQVGQNTKHYYVGAHIDEENPSKYIYKDSRRQVQYLPLDDQGQQRNNQDEKCITIQMEFGMKKALCSLKGKFVCEIRM